MQMRQQYDQATGHATWTPLATEVFFYFFFLAMVDWAVRCVLRATLRCRLERLAKRRFAN